MSLEASVRVTLGVLPLAVDLRVEAGGIVALLGPNGAGKTTLLRVIAGLLAIDTGRVVLDGRTLDDAERGVHVPPDARPIGVVFQDYRLFPHLSALDNVAFGLRCHGHRRADARGRAREWLERVGLADRAAVKPRELSGGQAQRVALARALATEPRVLLLDEPLAAVDIGARGELRRSLRRHLDACPGIRLLVTHDPLEALALASHLVVLEGGRVVQSGSPTEIVERPRSRYVADLVGVNLLRGVARDDRVALAAGGALVVPGAGAGEVFAVIHPRAVALHRGRPEGTPRNVWQARVAAVDVEGERVRIRCSGGIPIVAEVTPAAVADLHLNEGVEVWVSVKATEIAVYPA